MNPTDDLLTDFRIGNTKPMIIDDEFVAPITGSSVRTVDDAMAAFGSTTPAWLAWLMRMRNTLLRPFGFSSAEVEADRLPERIEPGQSVGLFGVIDRTDDQVVIGGDDRHFSMRIRVVVESGATNDPGVIRLATLASPNTVAGKAYLSLVKLPHRLVAAQAAKRIAAAGS